MMTTYVDPHLCAEPLVSAPKRRPHPTSQPGGLRQVQRCGPVDHQRATEGPQWRHDETLPGHRRATKLASTALSLRASWAVGQAICFHRPRCFVFFCGSSSGFQSAGPVKKSRCCPAQSRNGSWTSKGFLRKSYCMWAAGMGIPDGLITRSYRGQKSSAIEKYFTTCEYIHNDTQGIAP